MNLPAPDYILAIQPYEPGKPFEELEREYGITDSVKLASNENPLGPSPMAAAAVSRCLESLHRYPDASGYRLTRQLAAKLGVTPANIVLGNGSDDLIGMLARVFLQPGDEVLIPQPAFLMYDITVRAAGAVPVYSPLRDLVIDLEDIERRITPKTRMVFITNPHNPTGTVVTRSAMDRFLAALPAGVSGGYEAMQGLAAGSIRAALCMGNHVETRNTGRHEKTGAFCAASGCGTAKSGSAGLYVRPGMDHPTYSHPYPYLHPRTTFSRHPVPGRGCCAGRRDRVLDLPDQLPGT